MDINEALTFLGLSATASIDELDSTFRRLVMIYHPDRNPERSSWSHSNMIRLKEAHEIAGRYLMEPRAEPVLPDPRTLRDFLSSFSAAREDVLQGIHLYYTFSLENIHLRYEGVRRYRYNSSRNHIRKGITAMGNMASVAPSGRLHTHLVLFRAFAAAFERTMHITKTFVPDGSVNHKAYRHYHSGSLILDSLVRGRLFPEDFPRQDLTPKSIPMCEQEFFLILTRYTESTWLSEAVLKLSLLDSLSKLLEFESKQAR